MNTKKIMVYALFGLFINVAIASNSARIGYVSDFFYRGEQKAEESVQASVGLEKNLSGFEASLRACTNQAVDSSVDSYKIQGGLSKTFADDLLNAYLGLNHFEDVAGEPLLEVAVSVSYESLLSPTLSVYRNLDESLYTLEASLSHEFDVGFGQLTLGGSAGNTEITKSLDRDYYSVGSALAKSIGTSELGLSVDYVDADNIEREFVFGTSLSFQF
tara:strand:- start:10379 stop:11026 length:648 start_codon:yes stop_codon:yes gene_type:complete